MDIWQQIMEFTDQNAANVSHNQWNTNYLEVVGRGCEVPEKLDDICKRVPKLQINTKTRYIKPQGKSKLGVDFKYVPPSRKKLPVKTKKSTVHVSVKVIKPKANDSLTRNSMCTCRQDSQQLTEVEDNDEMSLEELLDIIQQYDKKPGTAARIAVSNLVRGYNANITLSQASVKRLSRILDSNDHVVQEVMLVLIRHLSQGLLNAKLFLEHGILDDLLYRMLMGSTGEIQTQAALCIAKLTEREELSHLWMETMVISGTEALFDVLVAEEGINDELCHAVLETIINIAYDDKMASKLIGFGLESVIDLTRCKTEEGKPFGSSNTKRLATKALTTILSHNYTIAEQFLLKYQHAIENVTDILQYCECSVQKEAANFFATLTAFQPSIDFLISHNTTQHLLWAMTCSHCRFVREHTSKAFKNITNNKDEDKLLTLLNTLVQPVNLPDAKTSQETDFYASLGDLLPSASIDTTNTTKIINAVKRQSSCTPLEKVMVEIFAVLSLCFQTDSLYLSGKSRTFASESKSCGLKNSLHESYLASLRVLTNILVAIETLICVKEKNSENNEAASLQESRANLSLATLFVQCSGLQFIDQLKFLSAKLQLVNSPSFHSIDPVTLPPREFGSSMKNLRTQLVFHGTRFKSENKVYPDFGLHMTELEFIKQTISLLTLLGQATAPDYDPAQEDLKVFQDRKRVVDKKRHISFRSSAFVVKNMVKLAKSTAQASNVEDRPANPGRKRSISRKNSYRSAYSVSSIATSAPSHVDKYSLPEVDLGTSSTSEMVHYLKQSLLNSHLISHLAVWITCGIYDIQVNVIKLLRYLMHVSHIPKQSPDSQALRGEPLETLSIRRSSRHSTAGQQSYASNNNSMPKSKSKLKYLGQLCVRHVVRYCGTYLLDLLKPPASKALGRLSLMVIREGAIIGEAECRFNFAKLGCFAEVIDFIRSSEDEPDIQALGLVVIRSLVSSAPHLKHLFFAHGGMSLVMALHEYHEGLVKDEAALTLTAFSKASTPSTKKKAAGSPKKRIGKSPSDKDIWDHVTQKWQDQDKVARLLKRFNVRY